MTQGYRDRRTAAFAAGEYVPAFQGFEDQGARRISILNAARSVDTLRALRGNRLEILRGTGPVSTPYGSIVNGASASVGLRARPDRETSRLWTITAGVLATMLKRAVHPGDVLRDELEERGVSPASFARQIDVPANRISQILAGKRAVTGDSALRFGHWFGMDPQFWLNLQAQYELAVAERVVGAKIRALPTAAGGE